MMLFSYQRNFGFEPFLAGSMVLATLTGLFLIGAYLYKVSKSKKEVDASDVFGKLSMPILLNVGVAFFFGGFATAAAIVYIIVSYGELLLAVKKLKEA